MKQIAIILVLTFFLADCSEEPRKVDAPTIEISRYKNIDTTFLTYTKQYNRSTTYPFSKASTVELLSYPDRLSWDTLNNKHGNYFNVNIIPNGQMDIDEKQIKDRILLTEKQQDDLFDLLYNVQSKFEQGSPCFEPRHAIVFYDKKTKAYAFIEICLECMAVRTSPNIKLGPFSIPKINELTELFRDFNVTYGLAQTE